VVTASKHQKEKRSMNHFAGLDVSVKQTETFVSFRNPFRGPTMTYIQIESLIKIVLGLHPSGTRTGS
jgi:hypothetical protein